jgi:arginase family enzyme
MLFEFMKPHDWSGVREGRFAARIRTDDPGGCAVGLFGVPDDTGVALNRGHLGAAMGPAAFRAALTELGTAQPAGFDWPGVFDAGDVTPGPTVDQTHERVCTLVDSLLTRGLLPVGIGGGHDLTLPIASAAAMRHRPLAGLYLDAHLDVREQVGSGMAFRRLLGDWGVRPAHIVGLDPHVNAAEHADWFSSHGGIIGGVSPDQGWPTAPMFVSIDLDAIDAAHAPGVSARNPAGLTARDAAAWAYQAGRRPNVVCFDIMELCPPRDESGRTARLAAHLFLSFLAGVAERGR